MSAFKTVEVVGGGLIGTSIALKVAQNGAFARLRDVNPAHQRIANELLGVALAPEGTEPNLVVVATPVDAIPEAVITSLLQYPESIVIDTGSIKTKVIHEVWTLANRLSNTVELDRFIPTHPMAGREVHGPEGARSDLFEGRAWALTPHSACGKSYVDAVEEFIGEMGATAYLLSPESHDRQVAMTSHLPQLLASTLASILEEPLDLAGQGLRDMTRLAHSDHTMWEPIFEGNAVALEPLVDVLIKSINDLKDKHFSRDVVNSLMRKGETGARLVPGKHGGKPRAYGALSVVIPDRPGQLGLLFNHCSEAQINIEDLRIEHSPGQETGLITLFVNPGDLSTLNSYLSTLGWHVTITEEGI